MKSKKFYLTTPLYYVNGSPHIGHAYTSVSADVLARYRRMLGDKVYFLTGTDEHGQKIAKSAHDEGYSDIKAFCDVIVDRFIQVWKLLGISYDDFIRTTECRHEETVKKILDQLYKSGDIYESEYQGWYCLPCETFWLDNQIENNLCPDCRRGVEHIKEKNYFLKISKYKLWLKNYLDDNKDFIQPQSRFNEVYSFLNNELNDLCISRPKDRVSWGISIPFDDRYVTYVWFEALLNYITAPGFLKSDDFSITWPADVHLMAKDILRYHAVYWPIMLHMLDLEPPKMVFAHGWWLMEEGSKMSKSKGNVIDPLKFVEKYGSDSLRYFLLREVSFGSDGSFSEQGFIKRVNSDLANDFGNLVFRTLNMVMKYYDGFIPESESAKSECDSVFKDTVENLNARVNNFMLKLDYQKALECIWQLIALANKYIEVKAPWNLKNNNPKELDHMIYTLSDLIRIILIALAPFMP
ncbi:MAG: methionine--tRNA ligase, partial [Candidatus Omnitrophica bacterium]|nr:methionine--tRNA ligase [Candidatus Omnitrophota bacterium]